MPLRTQLKRILPARTVEAYRVMRRVMGGHKIWLPSDIYQRLYEIHALSSDDSDAVGRGSYDVIGLLELELLRQAGMQPSHTLVDFGCGTGRLAVQAIPALSQGHYIGIDISKEMLRRLDIRLRPLPKSGRVSLLHQPGDVFPLEDKSVDFVCAYSVFTHMEHEDTLRYLRDARRIVKPGGRFVFSCLPVDTALGEFVFLESSSVDVQIRWARVRSVATSRDLMTEVARLAGWSLVRWYRGDEENIELPGEEKRFAFGQSVGVLE